MGGGRDLSGDVAGRMDNISLSTAQDAQAKNTDTDFGRPTGDGVDDDTDDGFDREEPYNLEVYE